MPVRPVEFDYNGRHFKKEFDIKSDDPKAAESFVNDYITKHPEEFATPKENSDNKTKRVNPITRFAERAIPAELSAIKSMAFGQGPSEDLPSTFKPGTEYDPSKIDYTPRISNFLHNLGKSFESTQLGKDIEAKNFAGAAGDVAPLITGGISSMSPKLSGIGPDFMQGVKETPPANVGIRFGRLTGPGLAGGLANKFLGPMFGTDANFWTGAEVGSGIGSAYPYAKSGVMNVLQGLKERPMFSALGDDSKAIADQYPNFQLTPPSNKSYYNWAVPPQGQLDLQEPLVRPQEEMPFKLTPPQGPPSRIGTPKQGRLKLRPEKAPKTETKVEAPGKSTPKKTTTGKEMMENVTKGKKTAPKETSPKKTAESETSKTDKPVLEADAGGRVANQIASELGIDPSHVISWMTKNGYKTPISPKGRKTFGGAKPLVAA